jgi:Putative GTPase activating protein for Arf/PH domain
LVDIHLTKNKKTKKQMKKIASLTELKSYHGDDSEVTIVSNPLLLRSLSSRSADGPQQDDDAELSQNSSSSSARTVTLQSTSSMSQLPSTTAPSSPSDGGEHSSSPSSRAHSHSFIHRKKRRSQEREKIKVDESADSNVTRKRSGSGGSEIKKKLSKRAFITPRSRGASPTTAADKEEKKKRKSLSAVAAKLPSLNLSLATAESNGGAAQKLASSSTDSNRSDLASIRDRMSEAQRLEETTGRLESGVRNLLAVAQRYGELQSELAKVGLQLGNAVQELYDHEAVVDPMIPRVSDVYLHIEQMRATLSDQYRQLLVSPLAAMLDRRRAAVDALGQQVRGSADRFEKAHRPKASGGGGGNDDALASSSSSSLSSSMASDDDNVPLARQLDTYRTELKLMHSETTTELQERLCSLLFANQSFMQQGYYHFRTLEQSVRRTMRQLQQQRLSRDVMTPRSGGHEERRTPEQQGYLLLRARRSKMKAWRIRWFAVVGGSLLWFKSWNDSVPAGQVSLVLTTVKAASDAERTLCFELVSPDRHIALKALNSQDYVQWMGAFRAAIVRQLASHSERGDGSSAAQAQREQHYKGIVAALVDADEANGRCADCGAAEPTWVILNRGIIVCSECSGAHRSLGTHVSRVRSLELDDWTDEQIDIVRRIGNGAANTLLAAKPMPAAVASNRAARVAAKHRDLSFFGAGPLDALPPPIDAVRSGNLVALLALIGAGALDVNDAVAAPLHAAIECAQPTVAAFLLANNADPNARLESLASATPLHHCASCVADGAEQSAAIIARQLLKCGASQAHLDAEQRTALDLARQNHLDAIVEILLDEQRRTPSPQVVEAPGHVPVIAALAGASADGAAPPQSSQPNEIVRPRFRNSRLVDCVPASELVPPLPIAQSTSHLSSSDDDRSNHDADDDDDDDESGSSTTPKTPGSADRFRQVLFGNQGK